MSLTPKDCLYIEDLVTAIILTIKKTECELKQVQEETVKTFLESMIEELKTQANMLVGIMEEN